MSDCRSFGCRRADGAEVGTNLGAAIPLSKYKRTAHTGGTFGFWGGYRWNVGENIGFSLIGQPQFTFMPTNNVCCGGDSESSMTSGVYTPPCARPTRP